MLASTSISCILTSILILTHIYDDDADADADAVSALYFFVFVLPMHMSVLWALPGPAAPALASQLKLR